MCTCKSYSQSPLEQKAAGARQGSYVGDVEWAEDQREKGAVETRWVREGCKRYSVLILGIIQVCWLMIIVTWISLFLDNLEISILM